jgi:hypothetical protein
MLAAREKMENQKSFQNAHIYASFSASREFSEQSSNCSRTWFEEAFSTTVQWNHQNAALHVIVALQSHLGQAELGHPAEVFGTHAAKNVNP